MNVSRSHPLIKRGMAASMLVVRLRRSLRLLCRIQGKFISDHLARKRRAADANRIQ